MPIFDLENLNPFTRFDWPDGSGAWVDIRVADIGKLRELRDKHYRTVRKLMREDDKHSKRRPAQLVEYEEPRSTNAEQEYNNDLWDYCIGGFEGFRDGKGGRIEATRENKILLMRGSIEFAGFVGDCLEELAGLEDERKEETEKNLETSRGGFSQEEKKVAKNARDDIS